MKLYIYVSLGLYIFLTFACSNPADSDNVKPTFERHYPNEFFIVSDTIEIYCEVTDNKKISNVELFVDGNSTGITKSELPFILILNTDNYSNGSLHNYTIRAYDKSNNMQESDSVPFLVQKKRIIFNSDKNSLGICIMNTDGTNKKCLIPGYFHNPFFSPDGNKIVYNKSHVHGDPAGLYIFNLNDSTKIRLTYTDSALPFGKFTPDGNKIITVQIHGGDYEICTINIDGSNHTNLTNNSFDENDIFPDISNDNTKIVYCKNDSGTSRYEIYIMNIDGTGKQKLTDNYLDEYRPQFSPDGSKILFSSEMNYISEDDLKIMNIDGSNVVSLSNANGLNYWTSLFPMSLENAQFSPDGNRIVFSAHGNIYLINTDGSNLIQLTNSWDTYTPQFSPDGSTILCQTIGGENRHLLVLNTFGYPPDTLLTEGSTHIFAATFEP